MLIQQSTMVQFKEFLRGHVLTQVQLGGEIVEIGQDSKCLLLEFPLQNIIEDRNDIVSDHADRKQIQLYTPFSVNFINH